MPTPFVLRGPDGSLWLFWGRFVGTLAGTLPTVLSKDFPLDLALERVKHFSTLPEIGVGGKRHERTDV